MGGMNTIYSKRHFNIYSVNNQEFIVHNTKLPFENHHTHINRFSTAKYLINVSLYKSIPKRLSNYLIISLIRLTDDDEYIEKLRFMLEQNKEERKGTSYKDRKHNYYNSKCRRCG